MFEISTEKIDPAELSRSLANGRAGALCTFEGWVRNNNENKTVLQLEYEAYESLCLIEAEKIIEEVRSRFNIVDVRAVHRVGSLGIGDIAVWIGVTAEHRDAAFAACLRVIDEIKSRLPIWKRETYENGRTEWINCQSCRQHVPAAMNRGSSA
jgi:molybdopterin synthase catalytic subunit